MKKIILSLIVALGFVCTDAFAQPANDNCATAQNLGTLPAPAACSGTAPQLGAPLNISGTNVGATPGSPYLYQPGCAGGAMSVPANDVWYTFTASSYQMVATVTSTFSTPNIAMYSGTCAALGGGVGGCAVGAGGTVTLTVEQMVPGTTYYIQISGATGQTGTFNLNIRNNKDCADCLNASTFTATPLPTAGMYAPGTVVNFCYHVAQYTQINTNWLHGVQLTFGSGWNLATLTTSPPPTCQGAGTGTWAYYPGGCTSTATGASFGPGFYFDTPDAGTNPGDNFGDNCSGVQGAGTWNFCFSIAVANGCSPGSNLDVTVNTSGDGESGSWSNAGCLDDPASVLPAVGSCCIPTMSSTPAPCGGTGTATATPVGVSGPYNYVWTNSAGTTVSSSSGVAGANTASGLAAGTYTVTMTNTALSCVVTNTVTVGGGGSIATPTAGSNSPVCAGGTLNLTAVTVAGATYSWTGPNSFSSGIQNPSIGGVTILAAGTYTVVANSGGCTASSTVTVVINPNPTVTVPPNITVCNGGNVPATAFTSTPAGATYTWTNSNPAIGVGASGSGNLPAFTATNAGSTSITGTITVTPTLAGCTGTPSSYTITVNPTPTVTVPANITVCNGGNVPASAYTSTPAGGTFTWTNSNPAIGLAASGAGNTPSFTATNPGAAAITATITVTPTVAGCPGTPSSYTITVNPTPTVTVPANITVCNSGNVPASAFTSTPAGGTFTWTNSDPSIGLAASGAGNTPAFTATNTSGSSVTATITVTPTVNGCVGTPSSYTITVNSSLTVNAGVDDSICYGASTVLNASPSGAGFTIAWSPATGLSSTSIANPTANPTATTVYTVTITDPTGCVGSDNVTIFVDPQLTVAVAGIDVTCNGACNGQTISIPAGGTPTYTYNWTGGCSSAACASLCPGSYTVTVTDSWGCTATNDTTVSEPTLLTAAITALTPVSCNGVCDGSATAAGNGGTVGGGYTYSWNTVPVQNTATATNLCAGSYTCTITDANSCTATTTVTINQPTVVTLAPIASVTICSGGSTVLTANASGGNGGPYSYSWSPSTGLSATNISNPTANPAVTTVYTVNATDVNGCPAASINVTVTVNPNLTVVAAGSTSICPGASAVITAAAANGNGGPYSYSWSPATGLSSTSISNPTASPSVTTVYTVTASDGCSPTATATVTITVLANPVVAFSAPASGCSPVCVTFTDASTVAGSTIATWSWTFGDGTTSNVQNPPPYCYTTPGSYNVGLTVTSAAGGCSSSLVMPNYVTVYPNPVADFSFTTDASVLDPDVQFTDLSYSNIVYWNWFFGDGDSLGYTTANPLHTYPNVEPGTYPATLIVMNAQGCAATVTYNVVINPEFTFFIPNAFSPNGDGVNDGFNGKGVGIKKYEIMIFDRWGNMIWYTDDINKLWDGKANHGSEMAQQDVYVWKVKLTDVFDKKHNYIGTVTIVK